MPDPGETKPVRLDLSTGETFTVRPGEEFKSAYLEQETMQIAVPKCQHCGTVTSYLIGLTDEKEVFWSGCLPCWRTLAKRIRDWLTVEDLEKKNASWMR